jgi:hypothetical protein
LKTKNCRRCKREKQGNEFYHTDQNSDGLTSYCKECYIERWREYNLSHKEIMNQKSKDYQKANKEKVNRKNRNYRKNNKEKCSLYSKKWCLNNLERVKARQLFNAAKTRARKKKISFNISIEWIFSKLKIGYCEYTGIKFDFNKNGKAGLMSPSIDRINPKLGYTENNCSVVLWSINAFKNQYDLNSIIPIAKKFIEYQSTNPANGTQGDPAAGCPPSVYAS